MKSLVTINTASENRFKGWGRVTLEQKLATAVLLERAGRKGDAAKIRVEVIDFLASQLEDVTQ